MIAPNHVNTLMNLDESQGEKPSMAFEYVLVTQEMSCRWLVGERVTSTAGPALRPGRAGGTRCWRML